MAIFCFVKKSQPGTTSKFGFNLKIIYLKVIRQFQMFVTIFWSCQNQAVSNKNKFEIKNTFKTSRVFEDVEKWFKRNENVEKR